MHQAARFTHNPRRSHEQAVKRTVRYLKKTAKEGLILKTNRKRFQMDCYDDADFARLFSAENVND